MTLPRDGVNLAAPSSPIRQAWARGSAAARGLSARTPLRVRLVALLLVLVTLALFVAGAAATAALRRELLRRTDEQLIQAARDPGRLVPGLRAPRGGQPPSGPDDERFLGRYYVALYDADGNFLDAAEGNVGRGAPALTATTLSRLLASPNTVREIPSADGDGPEWRAVAKVFPNRGNPLGVVVATPIDDAQETVRHLVLIELGVGLVVLLLVGGLGYEIVRRSLRPLNEVERTAAAIAAGDLTRRVPDRDPRTEVGRLSVALNGMLGRIESAVRVREASEEQARRSAAQALDSAEQAVRSEERMRRFITDASHELRTPLTSIRGFAELYRQGAAANEADVPRVMRRIEDEASRMGLLVDDLLLLARLDQQRPLERHEVDLLVLAADATHDARAVARDRDITLQVVDGPGAPVVVGDEARLRQVLGNLVGNALTHTPLGTPVTIRVGTCRDANDVTGRILALLEVADAGPGLSGEDRERVFERFYRADASRSRASGGTGLGLSIVAALTAAHGGRVEVDSDPGHGATFRVLLPTAA